MAKINVAEDTYLVGIGVSPGISIGEISIVDQRPLINEALIGADDVGSEIERFHGAVEEARDQLNRIKDKVSQKQHLREHLYILDTHLLILNDEMLIQNTEEAIRGLLNAESALKSVLDHLRSLFDNIEDEYLKERRSDVDAVGERLLRILTGVSERSIGKIGSKSLIVAHELSPAETMQMDRSKILGFITDKGGRTSHTAILARSLGIPAVVGLESVTALVSDHLPAIIDGSTGIVILNPSTETFKEYLTRKQRYEFLEEELDLYRELPAVMTDNVRISLRANLEMADEFCLAENMRLKGSASIELSSCFLDAVSHQLSRNSMMPIAIS